MTSLIYGLARMTLLFFLTTLIYSIIVICVIFHPLSWWGLLFLAVFCYRGRKKLMNLTAHGTAYWLGLEDAIHFRMLGGRALALGRLIGGEIRKGGILAAINAVIDKASTAEVACRNFFSSLKGQKKESVLIRMPPHVINTAVFMPVGTGKSSALAIPFLLECPDSCIVLDFKGELAEKTAIRRAKMGHEIAIFDPYSQVTGPGKLPFPAGSLNPLDQIDKQSMYAIDHARAAANAIVITTGEEKDPHWNESAEDAISGLIAVTAWHGQGNNRSLQDVDRLMDPKQLAMAIELMRQPDEMTGQYPWEGMLARMGGRMQGWSGEERSGIISTMGRHLQFLRTPAIAKVTRTSSFRPRFKAKDQTAYIILPVEFIRPMSGWTRLMIWALFTSVIREGLGESSLVHAVLDESAALQANFGTLEDAVDRLRGHGLRCQFYYQNCGQLAKVWKKDNGSGLLSNSAKIFAGTQDIDTAKLIESMLGTYTQIVEGESVDNSGGYGTSADDAGRSASRSNNRGWSKGRKFEQAPRELLKAAEILTLPQRVAITFPGGGVPPVQTYLTRYFEEPERFATPRSVGGAFSRFYGACRMLARSVVLLVAGIVLAVMLTRTAEEKSKAASMYVPAPAYPVIPNYQGF